MTAADYPVSFGYKAQDGYYYGPSGIVGLYHKGNDRSTPTGTPIVIGGADIGNTGATGLVSGPHLHTQAGTDVACQNTIDPSPLEFQPGTVVAVGNGNQWGNYITIQVGDRYITYCHLSWTNITKGQIIGGDDMQPADYATANIYAQTILFRNMGEDEYNKYHKGKTRNQLFDDFRTASERGDNLKKLMESDNKDLDAESVKLKEALKEFLN